ncbi:hypothetical protein GCK72_020772 [Caenorhabditis remanei]|uniref:Uncharacterized protein n=1 Tax=Caenorhabditis remanei TaxID=31234 RepID=A0A6A5GI52_CAERE|nr:hypothetical protein GCK72_020772 [Caenorhabditis remanei]KAF1754212.1 hypothetical protein GCK72_020772 [Caenorhabditis remanei]
MLDVVDSIMNDCWKLLGAGSHHELIACPDATAIYNEMNEDWKFIVPQIPCCCKNHDMYKTIWKEKAQPRINSMSDVILESMEKFLKHYQPEKYSKELSAILIWLGLVMKRVAHFAEQESIHLPPLYSVNPTNETKLVIRAFSVGNNLFVMAHELLKTLKDRNKDVSGFEEEVLRMPRLSTLSYREVLQKIDRNVLKNLEFVKMKRIMLMFAQTPIPTYDGAYCIFASEVLYELLVDMIVAKKVFHTIGEESWTHIKKFFKSTKCYFDESRGV